MASMPPALKTAAVAAVAAIVGGCSEVQRNHGYAPTDYELRGIVVGVDTRDSVVERIGPPGASGVLKDGDFYYVGTRFVHYAYREPKPAEREILAISFDGDDVVSNIERIGLEDGRVIALSRRVTDSNIKGITFMRQLFGNFGRIDVADALNDDL